MILFRADGNPSIGVGHVMRCLSIADALKKKNKEISFVTSDDRMKTTIENRGFSCDVLESDYRDLRTDFESEKFENIIKGAETIIVDSYYVSNEYFDRIRECRNSKSPYSSFKIIYIDDLCEVEYFVDEVINYNIYADREKYEKLYTANKSKSIGTRLILGTQFVPLRTEFSIGKRINISESVRDVLVMTGGADIHHTALRLIRAMKDYRGKRFGSILDDISFHFVIGAMSEDYEDILNELKGINNIIVHKDVKGMMSLMCSCDIAVSAAGSTLYELCSCGIPTITFVLADNQINGEKAFVECGSMISVGDIRTSENYSVKILEQIVNLSMDYDLRKDMAEKQLMITDGCGADRLADQIIR